MDESGVKPGCAECLASCLGTRQQRKTSHLVGARLGGKRLVKQSLAWGRCSVDASHSLNIEVMVPSPAGDAPTSQSVVVSQPVTGPASCWAAPVPPWPPQPIDGVPAFTDATQPGLPAASEGLQHPPPSRPLDTPHASPTSPGAPLRCSSGPGAPQRVGPLWVLPQN